MLKGCPLLRHYSSRGNEDFVFRYDFGMMLICYMGGQDFRLRGDVMTLYIKLAGNNTDSLVMIGDATLQQDYVNEKSVMLGQRLGLNYM